MKSALKPNAFLESKDYLRLQRLIEGLDAKVVGVQTKFEFRFNLDIAFNNQVQEEAGMVEPDLTFITKDMMGEVEEEGLRLGREQREHVASSLNRKGSGSKKTFHTQDNMVLIMDLIERASKDL